MPIMTLTRPGSPPKLLRPGVESFGDANKRLHSSVVQLASDIQKWEELETAVSALIDNQREFVTWWDKSVRPRGNQAKVDHSLLTVERAEEISGLSQQYVSRWRVRLRDEEAYKAAIIHKARKEAGFFLADPAAARGQPNREGNPDFWPTPPSLIEALIRHIALKYLRRNEVIWEPATGDRRIEYALRSTGRFSQVIGTDLYPRKEAYPDGELPAPRDFLRDPPPVRGAYVVTNGPFTKSDEFIARGPELIDAAEIRALVLLLRHDHLMAASKIDVLNRATLQVHCNWRPIWIKDTIGNPRWGFAWIAWNLDRHPEDRMAPVSICVAEPVEEQPEPGKDHPDPAAAEPERIAA